MIIEILLQFAASLILPESIPWFPILGITFFAVHPWYLSYTPTTVCPNNLGGNRAEVVGVDQPFHMTIGWGPIAGTQAGSFHCSNYDTGGSGDFDEFDGGYDGLIFSIGDPPLSINYPDPLPPPIAYDGTIATLNVISGTVSQSYASGSGYGLLNSMSLSIDKPGVYSIGTVIIDSNGFLTNWWAASFFYVTGSVKKNVFLSYGNASILSSIDLYDYDSASETQVLQDEDSGEYIINVGSDVVPIGTLSTQSVSYGCHTTASGFLVGQFTGSIIGRVSGYVTHATDGYTSSYYADVLSGSFTGMLHGKMCGIFDGVGVMSGSFDAGPIELVSASFTDEWDAEQEPYSGFQEVEFISGSISGSICCSITEEHDTVFPIEMVNLDDDRIRLYYAKKPPFSDTYEIDFIESEPIT